MGGELVGNSTSQNLGGESNEITTYYSIFDKLCPFYLSIGMTYQQYWYEDSELAKIYLEAYKLKQERDMQVSNYNMWLQGFYIYEAICDISPILNPFAKSGTKVRPYRKKPIPLTQKEIDEEKEQKKNERLQKLKDKLLASSKK